MHAGTLHPSAIVDALGARNLLDLLDAVCRKHRVTREDVCSRRRTQIIALARHELWWHLYTHPISALSYHAIGRLFDRNHSSILNGVRGFQRRRRRTNVSSRVGDASDGT